MNHGAPAGFSVTGSSPGFPLLQSSLSPGQQHLVWYPVALPAACGGTPTPVVSGAPLCMYVLPSPGLLPTAPSTTPLSAPTSTATPHTTPHTAIRPTTTTTFTPQRIPKPSFARPRTAVDGAIRLRTSPQTATTSHDAAAAQPSGMPPFVQQPVVVSPFANTASLLEKLPTSGAATPEPRKGRFRIDPLDATWNTEATLLASGTANSLEEMLDPKEIAAILREQQETTAADGLDPAAVSMIEELRAELTDVSVRARVLRLDEALCVSMVVVLDRQPELLADLCLKERGKIVAHLVERLNADQTFPLVRYALDNFMHLALSQSGCIALPRILSAATQAQRDVFFEEMQRHLAVLLSHPFGNFVVKHFVQLRDRRYNAAVCRFLCDGDNLGAAAANKCGSHILEDLLRHSAAQEVRPLIERAFGDLQLLHFMCDNQFANYCVQSMLTFLDQCDRDPAFYSFCVTQVQEASQGATFRKNILKRAMAGFSEARRASGRQHRK